MINEKQRAQVAALIADIERDTDAEFVAVLARRSDEYSYIPLLWAAALALLTPLVLLAIPVVFSAFEIALAQVLVFVVLSVAFRVPALSIRLIPRRVRFWRAANMARRQFLENNLHHTRGATGVLLFISEDEHYVEIIADRGINDLVDESRWRGIVDRFVAKVRTGETYGGLVGCISECGEILREKVPATEEKNELPNGLVILD